MLYGSFGQKLLTLHMVRSNPYNISEIFEAFYHKEKTESSFNMIEHTLVYVARGSMNVMIDGHKVSTVRENECVFVRKDHRIKVVKFPSEEVDYHVSVMLYFPRKRLFDFYKTISKKDIPTGISRSKRPVLKIERSPMLISLFDSFKPYWQEGDKPERDWLNMKFREAINLILHTDIKTYASLFDFTAQWRLDIMEFLEHNYMYDLSVEELAHYTGRSVATFKRDFQKLSGLSPRKWIINRRLVAARDMLVSSDVPISQIMTDIGFKNFSHFCRVYKEYFGHTPSETRHC